MRRLEIIGDEPVSLPEAKRQCFVTSDLDDSLIARLVSAAREYAETKTWRAIIKAKYVFSIDEFPNEIELPKPPAIDVEKIDYINTLGVLTELNSDDYQVDTDNEPARIRPITSWPATKPGTYGSIKVYYTAGYNNEPPEQIKQAILMIVKHWYDNPEAVVVGVGASTSVNEVPLSASHLLQMHSARYFV